METYYKITGNTKNNNIKILLSPESGLGVKKISNGYSFGMICEYDSLVLHLYKEKSEEPDISIELGKSYKKGSVFSFVVTGINLEGCFYDYTINEERVVDPYADNVMSEKSKGVEQYYARICRNRFSWEDDVRPQTEAKDLIIYKLHVKGYTMSRYSKARNKGTFKGIAEKIPYLKELGINALELMPCYEFVVPQGKNDFWGYESGFYFSPKISYSALHDKKNYADDLKSLVKKCHENGIEVIMEFFFPAGIRTGMVLDCFHFWKNEYHIDGAHFIGDDRIKKCLSDDPLLDDFKIFSTYWESDIRKNNLFDYNEGFLYEARKMLKGDENQLTSFLNCMRNNSQPAHTINFITYNNGFTLNDLVSYDRKHNEDNGENNRDGVDYNNSWNCGVEGPTKKKKVRELRNQQMKNALSMVLLSQGIPLIYAGDEFGNSQNGNNNAYCQDNETGWTDWRMFSKNQELFDFVKNIIFFRKEHRVIHMADKTYMTDYKYFGLPDLSYHGSKAWYPELEHYNRHAGVMLCGMYANEDADVYIAINMHWEEHVLALPMVSGKKWVFCFDTRGNTEGEIKDKKFISVPERTITVLIDEKNS